MSSDPRVFLAAERTLLAWLRTGLAVIGLGFIVARFGLFLELLALERAAVPRSSTVSGILGVLFVAAGAIAVITATIQHRRFVATLPPADLPQSYNRRFAVALSATIGLLGLALAVFLALTQD